MGYYGFESNLSPLECPKTKNYFRNSIFDIVVTFWKVENKSELSLSTTTDFTSTNLQAKTQL